MERFDPFHSMHFEREITVAERSWAEILTYPRGENPNSGGTLSVFD